MIAVEASTSCKQGCQCVAAPKQSMITRVLTAFSCVQIICHGGQFVSDEGDFLCTEEKRDQAGIQEKAYRSCSVVLAQVKQCSADEQMWAVGTKDQRLIQVANGRLM